MKVKYYIVSKDMNKIMAKDFARIANIYDFFNEYYEAEEFLENNVHKPNDYLIVPVIGE